jgi:multiple sugar transport system permease protein
MLPHAAVGGRAMSGSFSTPGLKAARWICIVGATGFAIFPIYWMVLVSLSRSGASLTWPPAVLPDVTDMSLDAYRRVFSTTFVPSWLANSLLIAVATTVLTIVIAIPAGYALSRAQGRERDVLGYTILLSKMIPGTLLIAPLYIMFHGAGILGNPLAVVLADASYTVPFAAWMMKSYIDGIPRELEEAALIDGDTPLSAIVRIILPVSAPSLAAVVLYVFIIAWNDFIYARTFLAGGRSSTITVGATTLMGDYVLEWGTVMAACAVATVPVLLLFLWLQKYFVRGIMAGHH